VRRILKNTTPASISNRIARPITNNVCGRSNGTSGPCKERVPSLSTVLSSVVVIIILQNALALLFGFLPQHPLFLTVVFETEQERNLTVIKVAECT
jgi:hypothetical protein